MAEITENILSLESPDVSTAYLIVRLANLHQRRINAELAKENLTYSQFVLLSGVYWLEFKKVEATQMALVNLIKFDKSTVSAVIKTLAGKHFLTRRGHPEDTRAKIVGITSAGIECLKKAVGIVYAVDTSMYSLNPVETESLNKMLLTLLSANE